MAETVSVIITTKNEEKVLPRLLTSLKTQSYPKIEIILVDNFSTDKTVSIAKKYTKKVFSLGPERSAQRNLGVKKSLGQYVLFLDADMALSKDVVGECVGKISRSSKIGAVAIPEESVAKKFWEKVKAFERAFYNKQGDAITDAARFFRKEAVAKAGGYDETITGPEDWDLPENVKKAGYKIARIEAKIYHYEKVPSPLKLAKKKYYYALTSYRYLRKHNIPVLSAKTIYFLRPVFYKDIKRLLLHPILTSAMFIMFAFEQAGGGLGYIVGKLKKL